jgi:subtilisin family serine protease
MLSALLALSMLVSIVMPVFAQGQAPGGDGGFGNGATAPQSARFVPVSPADAASFVEQMQERDWTAPRGSRIGAAQSDGPSTRQFDALGNQVVNVVVHLAMPALVEQVSAAGAERAAYASQVAQVQARVGADVTALGGKVLFNFTTLSSGIAAQIPANIAGSVSRIPGVSHVTQVRNYERDLTETVPFIGAAALQNLGVTGAGVKVAVIDSGIDFSHLAFGGPGTVAGWEEAYYGDSPDCDRTVAHDPDCAYANPADPTLFGPAAPRIKGGFDWLGEEWGDAGSTLILTDTNPIDIEGHGTHVADIIGGLGYEAGTNADGPYAAKGVGVAPEADIYGFKACASFSSSCNGLALLASVDNAADLDRDPTTVDPVDVINMSLGSSYGQPEDDLTYFSNRAANMGIIVVASAGNSANKPFIVGSPSIGDGVLSVAQTAVPSSTRFPLFYQSSADSGTINSAVFQPWSVLPGAVLISGTVAYGNSDQSNLNGCLPYTDDMTGKVVLADRGACSFSIKAENASNAGAVLSLIGLVAPGDPFEGGYGGGIVTIPSFMISQAASNLLKGQLANDLIAGIDPALAINLAYTMVGSSSRGPRNHDNKIKPEIGAPGASVSAIAGGGAESGPFGGTSGAAPMVSGVAALLKEVYGDDLIVQQYKALLMNSAELEIWEGDPGTSLAPITRIGGGQVDAAAAYSSTLLAWDSTAAVGASAMSSLAWTGAMSFGYLPVADYQVYTRTLTIKNLSASPQNVTLTSAFRYLEDENQGVVVTPGVATAAIPANGMVEVPVVLEISPESLHPWVIEKGVLGANGDALTFQEYDGYVEIAPQTGDPIHVVWHALPKAAADISVDAADLFSKTVVLNNASPVVTGTVDVFDLITADANDYGFIVGDCASVDLDPGCNESPVDIKEVGVRSTTVVSPDDFLEFAVTIWDSPFRAGQYPPEFDIYIDSDADGTDDYVIFNGDLTLNASDGRNVVFLVDLATNAAVPSYFIDSTFNTQNFILPMDAESIGVTPGQPFRFSVFAFDAYFTGGLWDCAPKVNGVCTGAYQYTPGVARFGVPEADRFLDVSPAGAVDVTWSETPEGASASPSQEGLLFMHRNALVERESDHIQITSMYLPVISR